MWIYIVIGIIVITFIYVFALYNSFIKLNNKVKEAFSTMDVYLKKRWDLIPNLVDVVKGYVKHEKNTLEQVISLRNSIYESMSNEDKIKTNETLNSNINKIMILSENYPELKASDNFKKLSQNLAKIEDEIANSRKYYNAVVRIFNNKIEIFPNNIFAKLFRYKRKSMFEASLDERENVKIKF